MPAANSCSCAQCTQRGGERSPNTVLAMDRWVKWHERNLVGTGETLQPCSFCSQTLPSNDLILNASPDVEHTEMCVAVCQFGKQSTQNCSNTFWQTWGGSEGCVFYLCIIRGRKKTLSVDKLDRSHRSTGLFSSERTSEGFSSSLLLMAGSAAWGSVHTAFLSNLFHWLKIWLGRSFSLYPDGKKTQCTPRLYKTQANYASEFSRKRL